MKKINVSQIIELTSELIVSSSLENIENQSVIAITADSRELFSGAIFLAIAGEKVDGHTFIEKAAKKGAVFSVGEKEGQWQNYLQVSSAVEFAKRVSARIYGLPQNALSLFGITGTNGKTTTAYMLEKILFPDLPVGVTGTVGYRFGDHTIEAPNTTPFVWKWYEVLATMKKWGAKGIISEVSSHALEQGRIEGSAFDVTLFTNLTQDHLDYHKSLEAYGDAKKLLFTHYAKEGACHCINVDDSFGQKLAEEIDSSKIVRFGIENDADISARIIDEMSDKMRVVVTYKEEEKSFTLPFRADFNLLNALGAAAAASHIVHPFVAFERLSESFSLEGRLERVGNIGHVFVDYAHTPDALFRVLTALRQGCGSGRLIVVFGAGGDRDRGKRSEMGRIAAELSDHAIVTSDNPRTENPYDIISEITISMDSSLYTIIENREEAIVFALTIASPQDTVLIAGKGHEQYQIIGKEKLFFSDKEIVLQYNNK
ncbi:UDP-N-acetylmuramoyl-L-alanyl-D-glutamate--2,6-diaminopimelate ligase [bacterium]|nr:UDP-N-acetylmuramoyl-L-alanyl-D-glutamate--2,6-diaminopimelate ligase [bacterium]